MTEAQNTQGSLPHRFGLTHGRTRTRTLDPLIKNQPLQIQAMRARHSIFLRPLPSNIGREF